MSYPYTSKVLTSLGVRSWINAKNWSTSVGGNCIDPRVLEAMHEVAQTFVDMHELIDKADARIAVLCHAEEAHITTGAGAAIELAVAACMAGEDYGKWLALPHTDDIPNQVLLPRGHFINYTPQWQASGAKTVEYGIAGTLGSVRRELEAAITQNTCCLAYTFSYNNVPRGVIPFQEIVEIARHHDLPVVVDAASELPPVENLHKFLDMGADVVCFSGGKAIMAPNNTGMMVGRGKGAEIVRNVSAHTFPHYGWGRGHKISKEQIVGFVTALEIFTREGDAWYDQQLKLAWNIHDELCEIPEIEVTVITNDHDLHEHPMMPHVPRVLIEWRNEAGGKSAKDLDDWMVKEDPPVFLRDIHYYNYYKEVEWRLIDTFFLRQGEKEIVCDRIKRFFAGLSDES